MLRIRLFGSTSVVTARGVLALRDFGGVKPRRILEILALNTGRFLSKGQLADLLWEGRPPADHIATLESYVSVLRGRLQPGSPCSASAIRTGNGSYGLDPARVSVDVDDFDQLVLASGQLETPQRLRSLLEALELAQGPLLEHEPYAEWVIAPRERYRTKVADANVRAAECSLALGDVAKAVALSDTALGLDPLNESGCQVAMRAQWAAGRPPEALRRYGSFRQALREDLGIDPSAGTHALFVAMLAKDGAGGADPGSSELAELLQAVVELYHRAGAGSRLGAVGDGPGTRSVIAGPPDKWPAARGTPERLLIDLVAQASATAPWFADVG